MAGNLKLGIRLTADGKGFAGEIRVGQKALDRFTGSTKAQAKAARSATSATSGYGNIIKTLHGHALRYGAGIIGITQVQRTFNAVLSKTIRQEQALAQVAARIKSTGQAAGYSSAALADMAAQLQTITTFGDEEILEAQSVLLSFRGIAGKAFEGATEAALGSLPHRQLRNNRLSASFATD